ncbi:flagellar protein FliT [Sporosarcina luteola]|uniref:flagellar protein FliT n=1 Tax=Sporosarcina luteola TaxID=582850 RepID=UPI00203B813E|nr:flagellar protein FliT [Sporosarcina luteola]MCM3743855.1 flagellar protein FliT [Sporosarcina luteola]
METSDPNQPHEAVREYGRNMIRPAMIRWQETAQLLLSATSRTDEEHRDAVIEEIDALLDERDALQKEISAPFTPEELELGKALVALEKQVEVALDSYMKMIRSEITAAQSKKEHVKSYVNPYGKVARDGTFYDTKQ